MYNLFGGLMLENRFVKMLKGVGTICLELQ